MKFNLIDGSFARMEALELLSHLISTKINFHISKIGESLEEEDIKHREKRIYALQNDLQLIRTEISKSTKRININCELIIS